MNPSSEIEYHCALCGTKWSKDAAVARLFNLILRCATCGWRTPPVDRAAVEAK